MTIETPFSKMFIRQNHPDFLDLPWGKPLATWATTCDCFIEVERGLSRHEVVFVLYETNIYVIKELPGKLGESEYRILRELEKQELPAVKPVGYAHQRSEKTEEETSIVITEYLQSSLPYRSLFMKPGLTKYQDRLLDALAVLLVSLHLKGVFWGDCSLSNILFRRDAGELQAYLVDAETSKIYPSLSDGQRNHDLLIMEENMAGGLMNLSAILKLPETVDIYEVGADIRRRYENLWKEITEAEIFDRRESYRIHDRIRKINELGFTVDEIELIATGEGNQVRMRPIVTERNYHQDQLHKLTGILTEEVQARQMMNEIYEVKARLTEKEKKNIPLSSAAFYWTNKIYYPTIEKLGLMYNSTGAPAIYCEVLEQKRSLSRNAGRNINVNEAIEAYRDQIRAFRAIDSFSIGIGGIRREKVIDSQDVIIGLSEDWKKRSIYQIYPRSFADSNHDGIGDLKGLISKLSYFKWLGVDTIWLAPIYPSPMVDFGYDITDYTNIDPIFGSLDDFDELVAKTHQLGLRIILDFPPNHSSDQHPWFKESHASRTSPKRDWYVWRDPREDGGPPNNWLAVTGGFSWNWDKKTKQYYLHSFLPCQPDLNWRNPEVRKAMLDSLRFWLDRGVDGLQLTMINWIAKDEQLHDDPLNPNYDPKMDSPYNSLIHLYSCNRPELFEYLKEIRQLFDEYPDRVLILEVDYSGPLKTDPTYFETGDVIDIPLDLKFKTLPWNALVIKEYVDSYERELPPHAWPNYQLGRHDQTRLVSRIGEAQARVAAMLLLTLRGIPFIYYGSELGMRDVPIPIDQMQDPWEKIVPGKGRDPERTPMQWSPKVNAGFSSVKPWLPIAEDYKKINVETERKNPQSLLNLYQQLITLRYNNLSLSLGSYKSEDDIPMDCYVYHRQYQDSHHLVTLNFSSEERIITLPALKGSKIALSTYLDRGEVLVTNFIPLRGNEGCLIELAELEKE